MTPILSASEAKAAGLHLIDGFAFRQTVAALEAGLPAFWSLHKYHDQTCINAMGFLHCDRPGLGLEAALDYVGPDRAEEFLAGLVPANHPARVALIVASVRMNKAAA